MGEQAAESGGFRVNKFAELPRSHVDALTLKSLVYELIDSGTWQGVTAIAPASELSGSPAPP